MKRTLTYLLAAIMTLGILSGCENYFGEKTDLDFIEVPDYDAVRQLAYVPILPVLDMFNRPTDICVGFDELIYVVDAGTEEVVALDQAGRELGRKFVPGAKAVAQDRAFDLLVIGTFDTVLIDAGNPRNYTFSAIYRLRQFAGGGYNINQASVVSKVVHPFYTGRRGTVSDEINTVQFNKIAVVANNSDPELNNRYYVTRSGSGNSGAFTPNDAVLYFGNDDQFITTINVNTSTGVFNDYFQSPSGITTFAQPPQLTTRTGRDFLFTSLEPATTLKVQNIEFIESEFTAFYRPRLLASGDTSQADGFINSPNKFSMPTDITVTGDGTEFIFVVDAETDSLYQFTTTGFEGVLPPAASGIDRYQKVSFGGTGTGATQFNRPMGVAYFDRIVYVADSENGRVLRFQLTTDFR